MSHFTVLVIGDDVEEKLRPFQENNMGDCPEEFLEFEVTVMQEDFEKDARRLLAEAIKKKHDWAAKYQKYVDEKKFADLLKDYHGGEISEDGNLGYWHNPNAKWDWYQVGGRWAGMLIVKEGKEGDRGEKSLLDPDNPYSDPRRCDSALIEDLDFDAMEKQTPEEVERLTANYQENVEGKGRYKPEYFLKRFPTLEEYLKRNAEFSTHAVLDENGEWHEQGSMGWFGMSSETPEEERAWHKGFRERFLANLKPGTRITVVDCHI